MNQYRSTIRLQLALKRTFDILLSASALVFLLPLIALLALTVKLESRGPAFYRHRRVGKDGRPFDLLKFRSMVARGDDSAYLEYLHKLIESERNGKGLPYRKMESDPRITRVGRFLRRFYLDELPQVLNIMVGDMSIVGPRPHVELEVKSYTPEQQRRLTVRPGATGLWQATGKAECTFSELIAMDLKYIDEWNLALDLKIILKTFLVMMRGGEGFWAKVAKRIPAPTLLPPETQGSYPVQFPHENPKMEIPGNTSSSLSLFNRHTIEED
jgi:lipopolysaccharide/colanic/teichoic acid biosynthesis glycosyltransferase